MKISSAIFIVLFINITFSQSTSIGENIIDTKKLEFLNSKGKISKITKSKDDGRRHQYLFETIKEPKFIYNCSNSFPLVKNNYKKGTVFLLTFDAKTETASLETGEAKALFIFKQLDNYQGNLESTQSFSSDWQTYYIPFEADRNIKEEDLGIVMQYGFRPQSFILKNIKFEVFPEGTSLESLPKTEIKYQGMEADAAWREEANKRIEILRKGDFEIQFTRNGEPLQNKNVGIKLIKHAFPFGAALNGSDVLANNFKYKNFKKSFNLAVFENDLKIKSWSNAKKKEETINAIKQLKSDGINVKGHVLIWPRFNYLTPEIEQNKDNPEKVIELVKTHVTDVLTSTKGYISNWDVVNEAYTNKDLQNITGSEDILFEGFKLAKTLEPNVRRFTNEYGIISKGGLDIQKQKWYYEFIKRIDENTGGLVQGIGIQSHIGSDLTPPERVLEILAFYATLGKQISISEFTMDIQEPKIREQYTRDFMIAAFSHPNVSEFLFWGYTENMKKKVDIFKPNGDIGAMGKAYFSLMEDEWKTNLVKATNQTGIVLGRGFYGTYEYSFLENNQVVTGTFELKPRSNSTFKMEL